MIQSPCTRHCCLSADGFCLGCGRSIGEIAAWASLSDAEKIAILSRIAPLPPSDKSKVLGCEGLCE